MSAADPTGRRHVLTTAEGHAEITEVGASLRVLRFGGVDLVPPYPADAPTPGASGIVLVPWPNRVRDGAWHQRGTDYQLALTEPKLGNASHGLLRFAPYRLIDQEPDALTLGAEVFPQTGYPFHLDTRVRYALSDDGLTVRHTITNIGGDEAPVAVGAHPYLWMSDVDTADLEIQLAAETWFRTDERSLPIAEEPVDPAHDLREPRRVGDLSLDTAFGEVSRGADGTVRATLRAPDGRTLALWGGPAVAYFQVFTSDRYPGQELALAIEPMTAPPDALNSGRNLRWLAPGASWDVTWGITYRR